MVLDLCRPGPDFGNPGPARFYTYYPGMAREPDGVTCWGRYGNGAGSEQGVQSADYASSLTMSRGVWHHIEFWVEINTPGRADGRQGFWIDGKPKGSWSGLAFRDSEIQFDSAQLANRFSSIPRSEQLEHSVADRPALENTAIEKDRSRHDEFT